MLSLEDEKMRRWIVAATMCGLAGAATFTAATDAAAFIPPPPVPVAFPYEVMAPGAFQVFVEPWSPPSAPHCVAIRSATEWTRAFHPAPVMRGNRPFAPPPGFWRDHIVLVIARAMPMADIDDAIRVEEVNEIAGRLQVQLNFRAADSSATMNAWKGIVIGRPDWLSDVSFRVGDETICSLATSAIDERRRERSTRAARPREFRAHGS
jgi:hypothetical protein